MLLPAIRQQLRKRVIHLTAEHHNWGCVTSPHLAMAVARLLISMRSVDAFRAVCTRSSEVARQHGEARCCLRPRFSNARTAMRWVTTDRRAYSSRRTACARLHAESLASSGEPTRGDAPDGIGMPMRSLTCAASRGAARSVVSDTPPSSQHDQNCYLRASERPRRSLVNQLRDFQPADDCLGRDSPAAGRGRNSTSRPDALRRRPSRRGLV